MNDNHTDRTRDFQRLVCDLTPAQAGTLVLVFRDLCRIAGSPESDRVTMISAASEYLGIARTRSAQTETA